MSDPDRLAARLDAVERTLAAREDDAVDTPPPGDAATDHAPTRADLAARLDEVEERLATLEAELRAVRGYLGDVEAADDAVERRADAALAAAERALAATEESPSGRPPREHDGDHVTADDRPGRPDPHAEGSTEDSRSADDGRDDPADDEAPWPVRRLREAL